MINLGTYAMTAIGPNLGGQGSVTDQSKSAIFCGPDDNSCVVFADYNGATTMWPPLSVANNVGGFNVFVVDISGKWTYYSSGPLNPPGHNYFFISSIAPFGGGLFLVTVTCDVTRTYWVQVGNHKLNNVSPIQLTPATNPISNSCYSAGTPSLFYDGTQKLLAAEFIQPVGQNGDQIYSTIYKVSAGALGIVNQGYVGYANSSLGIPDPFNLIPVQQSGLNASLQLSNGINYGVFGFGGTGFKLARQVLSVNPGVSTSDCVTKNGSYVTAAANDALQIFGNFGGQNYSLGDSSVPRIVGLMTSNQTSIYFAGDNFAAYLKISNPTVTPNFALTSKYLFFCDRTMPGYTPAQVYYIPIPAGLANGSAITGKLVHPLVNNVRPVSLTGRYKA